MNTKREITGVVLAGGRGQRMGERDKGLLDFHGKALATWAIERLRPQVEVLLISANRHQEAYAAMGAQVICDVLPEFAGPLAGLQAGLTAAKTQWVVTVPCDSPLLPRDLVKRLDAAALRHPAKVAVASDGMQRHPVFCLCHVAMLPKLNDYLARGERRVERWLAEVGFAEADFSDQPAAFANLNTPSELSALEQSPTRAPPK